jgi:adenosylcobinamide-GDP ribazoletransferase
MREFIGFVEAIRFLTIIPMPGIKISDASDLGRSLSFFPLIGLTLGAILWLIYYLLSFVFPAQLILVLVIIAQVILTGAHHVDGLMDTFDGLFGGKTVKKRLAIMADTKVGTFGITAAILLFILKYAALISNPLIIQTLLLMPVFSRWMMVSAVFTVKTARDTGMGYAFKQGANWQRFIAATMITLIISIVIFDWRAIVIMTALWIIVSLMLVFFKSRFGGLTGDNYGAVNEISEVLVVLLMIAVLRYVN